MASLIRSNKHLASSAQRQAAVRVTVATSSAIEGIHAPFKPAKTAARKPAAAKLKRSHAKSS
jgi:hypothetical protein